MPILEKEVKTQYFMDDQREAQRLDKKVNPDEFIDNFISSYLADKSGFQVLDVGCGAGMIASTIAKRVENTKVIGVDISKQRLENAREKTANLPNTQFLQGSIYQIPLPDNSVDLVYTRFLLEYLTDPQQAIGELKRVCKKGGTIILQDLDAQLVSHFPYSIEHLHETLEALVPTGFDPYIGRKLFSYAKAVGLEHLDTDIRVYHKIIGKVDDINHELWDLKLDIALPKFSELIGEEKAKAFKKSFMQFLLDDNTLLFSNLFTVYMRKP